MQSSPPPPPHPHTHTLARYVVPGVPGTMVPSWCSEPPLHYCSTPNVPHQVLSHLQAMGCLLLSSGLGTKLTWETTSSSLHTPVYHHGNRNMNILFVSHALIPRTLLGSGSICWWDNERWSCWGWTQSLGSISCVCWYCIITVSSLLLRCSACFGVNVGYLFMSVTDDVQ